MVLITGWGYECGVFYFCHRNRSLAMDNKKEIDWNKCNSRWKDIMMRFLKMYGNITGDWYPERWEEHGITAQEAKEIITEYEKLYPEDK